MREKNHTGKATTIGDLAQMVAKGFEEAAKAGDVRELKEDMNKRFYEVNQRLGRIEKDILEDYGNRIEILESQIRSLQSKT
ncbi:MAG: hypothetical protein AAB897_01345 [Patescibacteria group bacterium]